jgi:hypothetical protein
MPCGAGVRRSVLRHVADRPAVSKKCVREQASMKSLGRWPRWTRYEHIPRTTTWARWLEPDALARSRGSSRSGRCRGRPHRDVRRGRLIRRCRLLGENRKAKTRDERVFALFSHEVSARGCAIAARERFMQPPVSNPSIDLTPAGDFVSCSFACQLCPPLTGFSQRTSGVVAARCVLTLWGLPRWRRVGPGAASPPSFRAHDCGRTGRADFMSSSSSVAHAARAASRYQSVKCIGQSAIPG